MKKKSVVKSLSVRAQKCVCGRILFPTVDDCWPAHLVIPVADGTWCDRSDMPVVPGATMAWAMA